jgi:hypothetical protein
MLHLSDCNFIWFAEIFKEMLLFHGTNLPKVHSSGVSSEASERQQKQYRNLEERLGTGGRAQGTPSNRRHVMGGSASSQAQAGQQKMASLFSALRDPSTYFPGYQQFFFRYLLVVDSARLNSHLCDVIINEIFSLTNVNSEGPYHDYVLSILKDGWLANKDPVKETTCTHAPPSSPFSPPAAASPVSPVSAAPAISRIMSFTSRLLKLKILGKFLGLLHFYHSWNLSVGVTVPMESPLMTLMINSAALRSKVNPSTCIPLSKLIAESWKEGTLMLTSPWVLNYLRMLAWDRTSLLNIAPAVLLQGSDGVSTAPKEHVSAVVTLASIFRAQEFSLKNTGGMSRNRYLHLYIVNLLILCCCLTDLVFRRMYILMECQSFFTDFPSLKQFVAASTKQPLSSIKSSIFGSSSSTAPIGGPLGRVGFMNRLTTNKPVTRSMTVDSGNAALSMSFMKHFVPHLYNTILYMQQRRAWAVNQRKRLEVGGSAAHLDGSQSVVTRRQTPMHISSYTATSSTAFRSSANTSSGHSAAWGSVPPSPTPGTPRSMSFDMSARSPARPTSLAFSGNGGNGTGFSATTLSSLLTAMSPPPPPAPFGTPSLMQGAPSGLFSANGNVVGIDAAQEQIDIHSRCACLLYCYNFRL